MNLEIIPMDPKSDGAKLAKLFAESDTGVDRLLKEIDDLTEENSRLRVALSRVVNNIGNGSSVSTEASIEFFEAIPNEVKLVIGRQKQIIRQLTAEVDQLSK